MVSFYLKVLSLDYWSHFPAFSSLFFKVRYDLFHKVNKGYKRGVTVIGEKFSLLLYKLAYFWTVLSRISTFVR